MSKERLNVVDDSDNIISAEERRIIHERGLLHREVHIYFVTPDKKIIFQHRAKNKDTFPDLLDATVGGHVEVGDNYEDTAIKEALEETGLKIEKSDLITIEKTRNLSKDKITGKINNAFRDVFVYIFKGDINDLRVEDGKGIGFEAWSIGEILNADEINKKKFIPYVYNFAVSKIIEFINKL